MSAEHTHIQPHLNPGRPERAKASSKKYIKFFVMSVIVVSSAASIFVF